MRYPLDSLENPRVVLDYDGYLASHPEKANELGNVLIIAYRPGASRPTYSMCDTVAMVAQPGESLDALYKEGKRAAPLARQAIFYGKEVSAFGSREDACAVCVDRNFGFRQKHFC